MAKKCGRPHLKNPRVQVLGVRVTAADHERIKTYAREHHTTISKVVLAGLDLLYNKDTADK